MGYDFGVTRPRAAPIARATCVNRSRFTCSEVRPAACSASSTVCPSCNDSSRVSACAAEIPKPRAESLTGPLSYPSLFQQLLHAFDHFRADHDPPYLKAYSKRRNPSAAKAHHFYQVGEKVASRLHLARHLRGAFGGLQGVLRIILGDYLNAGDCRADIFHSPRLILAGGGDPTHHLTALDNGGRHVAECAVCVGHV